MSVRGDEPEAWQNESHRLLDLIAGHRSTAVLHAAVQLEIPDALAPGPVPLPDLATRTNTEREALRRMMRALEAFGLVEGGEAGYGLTSAGRLLRRDVPGSLRAWLLFEASALASSWAGLDESVRSGRSASDLGGNPDRFAALSRDPEASRRFQDAMVSLTASALPPILAAIDLEGARHVIDVGGGYGELLCGLLVRHPGLSGTVLDLPACREGALRHFARDRLEDRANFVEGNFFDEVPQGGDVLIAKSVLHDWKDDQAEAILAACRRALEKTGRLLVIERLLRAPAVDANDLAIMLSDLNMLRGPGGRERTEAEYRGLLESSGFALRQVVPAGRYAVLYAEPD